MVRQEALEAVLKRLRRGGRTLIASHVNPDGDSVGSQLAMHDLSKRLGCKPVILSHDPLPPKYRFLANHELIATYDRQESYSQFDLAILLEAPETSRIGDVETLLEGIPDVVNIDHHRGSHGNGAINLVDENEAAAAILVYELFQQAGESLSKDNAEELYLAIMTDTGRFRFSNTTAKVMQVSADLIAAGASPKIISEMMYSNCTENELRLLGKLISQMELYHEGQSCFLLCDKALCEEYGTEASRMEGLVDYSLYTTGVKIGVLLRERENNLTKVSLRSNNSFDVSELARFYGGGGHRNAAGCEFEKRFDEVRMELVAQIGTRISA